MIYIPSFYGAYTWLSPEPSVYGFLLHAGFVLFSDNMIPFSSSHYVLIVTAIAILLGNACFPLVMRLIVYMLYRASKKKDAALKLLLDHPRQCYQLLFGSVETMRLMMLVLGFMLTEFILSIGVEYHEELYRPYSSASRVIIILFQTASTRSAGFNAIDISQLAASISVLSVLMMYVAVVPQAVTIRTTRVQKSSGLSSFKPFTSRLIHGLSVASQSIMGGTDVGGGKHQEDSSSSKSSATTTISDDAKQKGVPPRKSSSGESDHQADPANDDRDGTTSTIRIPSPRPFHERVKSEPSLPLSNSGERRLPRTKSRSPSPTCALTIPLPPPQDKEVMIPRSSSLPTAHFKRLRRRSAFVESVSRRLSRINVLRPVVDDLDSSPFKESKADTTTMYGLISRDLPMLFLALFLICISDDNAIRRDIENGINRIAIWPIFYEVISAFGTVGLSYGKFVYLMPTPSPLHPPFITRWTTEESTCLVNVCGNRS